MGSGEWELRDFCNSDWQPAVDLWRRVPGMGLSASDGEAEIHSFLARNPGLCLVAESPGGLIGTVLAGFDGRRGYIYHACVDPAWQGRGIGNALMTECLARLRRLNLYKVSLYCKADNGVGRAFWEHSGWTRRDDLALYSLDL